MSQFAFLQAEFSEVHEHAVKAESLALSDPRSACFYARLALEVAVKWMYRHDRALRSPYETTLSALIHEPTFRKLVGDALVAKGKVVKDLGNAAVHEPKPVAPARAITAVRELFHISYWLVRTYAKGAKPAAAVAFSADALPYTTQVEASTLGKLKEIARRFEEAARDRDRAQQLRLKSDGDRLKLETEIKRLQDEIAKIKKANQAVPDGHDYNEAQTRDAFIDLLLAEAGWTFTKPGYDTECPISGMPNATGEGFVDYVLWGDDGRPLGLVEAKRTRRDAREGQRQAELYADALERQFGQRPIIFYSNGMSIGSGMTAAIRRAQSRVFSRRMSWSLRSSGARHASRWRRRTSTQRLSSVTTRLAPFAALRRLLRRTICAKRCWSWRRVLARRAPSSHFPTC